MKTMLNICFLVLLSSVANLAAPMQMPSENTESQVEIVPEASDGVIEIPPILPQNQVSIIEEKSEDVIKTDIARQVPPVIVGDNEYDDYRPLITPIKTPEIITEKELITEDVIEEPIVNIGQTLQAQPPVITDLVIEEPIVNTPVVTTEEIPESVIDETIIASTEAPLVVITLETEDTDSWSLW